MAVLTKLRNALEISKFNKLYTNFMYPNHVRFQYGSNYMFTKHSKFNGVLFPYLIPISQYLVLNGNVGDLNSISLRKFLNVCSQVYEKIWWIPGPLELSHPTQCMFQRLDQMRCIANSVDGNGIIYVGAKSDIFLYEHNLTILSTTGWGTSSVLDSNVKHYNPLTDSVQSVNIHTMARCEEAWLNDRVLANSHTQTLVFTHHYMPFRSTVKSVSVQLSGNVRPSSGFIYNSLPWFGSNPYFEFNRSHKKYGKHEKDTYTKFTSYSPIAICEVKCGPHANSIITQ
jgi:hypothetical protein